MLFDSVEIINTSHNSNSEVLYIALMKCYSTVENVLPLICLIASLKTYNNLLIHLETLAMHAAGLSHIKMILPSICAMICFFIINIIILNPLGSWGWLKYEALQTKLNTEKNITQNITQSNIRNKNSTSIWLNQICKVNCKDIIDKFISKKYINNILYNTLYEDNKEYLKEFKIIIHAINLSREKRELYNPEIFFFDKNNQLIHRIYASKLRYLDDKWLAQNVTEIRKFNNMLYNPTINILCDLKIESNLEPHLKSNLESNLKFDLEILMNLSFNYILSNLDAPQSADIFDLYNLIKFGKEAGFNTINHQLRFFRSIFTPLFLIGMIILGYSTNKGKQNFIIYTVIKLMIGIILYCLSFIITHVLINYKLSVFTSTSITYVFIFTLAIITSIIFNKRN